MSLYFSLSAAHNIVAHFEIFVALKSYERINVNLILFGCSALIALRARYKAHLDIDSVFTIQRSIVNVTY